ncbi:MAG: efflux RND transporter periplasmic adaptor subunit [Armatimonadetes bacterium]|nr:efflux RND transporter periplasmic adaptor subunit [Armatimonadota bacterium]
MTRSPKRATLLIGAALVIVVLILFLRPSHHKPVSKAAAEKVKVQLLTVRLEAAEQTQTVDGVIQPLMRSTLSPKISSTVSAVMVREGDRVVKGQALVRLEARDLRASVGEAQAAVKAAAASATGARTAASMEEKASLAQVQSAEAALKQAKQQLEVVRRGARSQERAQAELAVVQAKAGHDLAASEAARMQKLFEQDVVTKQRLEQALAAEKTARAVWESAKQHADLVQEGSRREHVRTAEERVAQAEAGVRAARAQRLSAAVRREQARAAMQQTSQATASLAAAEAVASYSVIRAPFSGVVTMRYVDPGDQVGPGSPVIDIEDTSQWRIGADVPELLASKLSVGQAVKVSVDVLGAEQLSAEVVEIRPSGNSGSHTVRVKARTEPDRRLRAGQFGRLIIPGKAQRTIVVPESAVVDAEGLAHVWAVDDNDTAHLSVVTLGEKRRDQRIVLSGLNSGQRIAISNLDALSDGVTVSEQ